MATSRRAAVHKYEMWGLFRAACVRGWGIQDAYICINIYSCICGWICICSTKYEIWVPLRASCVQRLFIKQVSFKQIVSNSSESGVVCGRTLTTMEPSVLIFKWNLRPSVLNVDPQTEPSRRLMAAWTMLSQESSCVGTDENHNKILGPSSVLCPSLPAPSRRCWTTPAHNALIWESYSDRRCTLLHPVYRLSGFWADHIYIQIA